MQKTKYKNKQWLKKEYIDKEKSTYNIAKDLPITQGTIRNWLHKFDIALRNKSEAETIGQNNGEIYKDREWLEEQLKEKQIKPKEIARNLNISLSTIHKWIKKIEYYLASLSRQRVA